MKFTFFILILLACDTTNFGQTNNENAIALCCEEGRGCTGSSYCTACKNCSGCRHCAKNGGSCGVCSTVSNKNRSSSKRKSGYSKPLTNTSRFLIDERVKVTSTNLNLREGPSTNYRIIKKLTKNTLLIVLETRGRWLKVKVDDTIYVGFVYDSYVHKN